VEQALKIEDAKHLRVEATYIKRSNGWSGKLVVRLVVVINHPMYAKLIGTHAKVGSPECLLQGHIYGSAFTQRLKNACSIFLRFSI
jgi:hypothetical protein